jgi:hypothetical protein
MLSRKTALNWKWLAKVICLGLVVSWAGLLPRLAPVRPVQAAVQAIPYIGAEHPVSDFSSVIPASGEHPAAAFNPLSRQFLAVWESLTPTRKIAARLLSENGQPQGEAFVVSSGSRERLRPAVAYNRADREYLVVWMQDASGDASRFEIWGQRLNENRLLVDSPFLISSDRTLSLWSPRLVWAEASNQYLVVWETRDSSDIPDSIGMKLLLANGDSIAGMTLSAGDVTPETPDVVFNSLDQEYLITWTQQNPDGSYALAGTRRDLYGNRTGASPFAIYTSSYYLSNGRLAWNSQGYAVAFELAFSSYDHDIFLSSFDRAASSFPPPAGLAQTWREERFPQIVIQGGLPEFWVVYRYENTSGTQLWLHDIPLAEYEPDTGEEILLSDRSGWTFNPPALVSGAYGALAVYAGGLSEAAPHVYARGFWPIQAYLPLIQSR